MKKLLYFLPVLAVLFSPTLALATAPTVPTDTATWNYYIYPDQQAPNTTAQANIVIKNNTGHVQDSIDLIFHTWNSVITSATATDDAHPDGSPLSPSYFPSVGNRVQFGSFVSKLGLKNGETINIWLNINIGVPHSDTDPDYFEPHGYLWNYDGSSFTDTIFQGNTTFLITSNPNPTQQPLNWGLTNQYSKLLNKSGIANPLNVQGLFPPGPVDTLIMLPVSVFTEMYQALTNPSAFETPTLTYRGTTLTFPSGQTLYNVLGTGVTTAVGTVMTFLLLWGWLHNLYGRLQRATSLRSRDDDAWGLL